ncbi:MAG TPA: hypothetical protein VN775_05445 [Opitutaceae bacterium]|nr:hypothetical protein [Opitutaceae bacterium]
MPAHTNPRPRLFPLALVLAAACGLGADPLSKKTEFDFYRDVLSRDLHGLATRSDGRLVAGPVFTDLKGGAPCELLWCLEPGPRGTWLVGGGPSGQILEVAADPAAGTYTAKELAKVGDPQVYALKQLPDGSILAGTSPRGGLYLLRGGKIAARTGLPVDSIFDFALLEDGRSALAATGNPGRIYKIDVAKFAAAGVSPDRTADAKALAGRGVSLFGEVSDRNLRRIARLADGRIAAGSAPKGDIYLFGADGGSPFIAQENHDAEVTDLLADPKGGYYAAIVFSGGEIHPVSSSIQITGPGESTLSVVVGAPAPSPNPSPTPMPNAAGPRPKENAIEILNAPAQVERFQGRSSLQWFSADGFPETLASRSGVAFYRMCRLGDLIVISGGEQGEISGYDLVNRLSLTFAGSASSQVNALEPVPGSPGRFFAMRNNAPGFALLDFNASTPRSAETKRVDLGSMARLGAVRFNRVRDLDPAQLSVSVRTTNGSNETDGWSAWVPMANTDGWRAEAPNGRYVELRLALPAASKPTLELDKATVYYLGQNHRPQLQEFRMLSPNFAIVVPPEMPSPVVTTVGQLIQSAEHEGERRKSGFMGSQIVASPGTRVAFWTVNDPDGDNLLYTFSIRRDGDPAWTDISVDSRESYVQFDTLHLQEGTWFTRLVARETAPRPEAQRLSVTFETDDLVVDHTPPEIEEASVRREAGKVVVTVRGRDALSLLDSAEFDFNNGVRETVEQPADGILDGRQETFVLELPLERLAGATSVEVTLYDSAGNGATRRLAL